MKRFAQNHAWAAVLSSTMLLGQAVQASELTSQQEDFLKEIAQRVEVLSQERSTSAMVATCECSVCQGETGKPLTQSGVDALFRDSGSVAITVSGSYYLEESVTLPAGLTIGDGSLEVVVELCLQGNVLSLAEGVAQSVVTVTDGGTLKLYGGNGTTYGQWVTQDSGEDEGKLVYVVTEEKPDAATYEMFHGGAITGGTSSIGAGLRNQGHTIMYSGNIIGNRTNQNGGGVYNSATFELYGGEISYNHSDRNGGGLFNNNSGTLTLHGGALCGNTSDMDGGGIFNNNHMDFYSGLVMDNQGRNGGGVYNNQVLFMGNDKPTVTCNYATVTGGGVYNASLAECKLSTGSLLSSNHADSYGGGVFNAEGGAFSMNSGVIYSNQADVSGGGAYNQGEIALSGGTIWCNHGEEGSGIYQNGVLLLGTATEEDEAEEVEEPANSLARTTTGDALLDGVITIAYNDLFLPEGQVVEVVGEKLPEESQIYVSMSKVGVFAENIPSVIAGSFQSFDTEFQVEFDQEDAKLKVVSRTLEEIQPETSQPEEEFHLSEEPFTLEEMKTEFNCVLTDKNTFIDLPILENTDSEYFLGWTMGGAQLSLETVVKDSDEMVALWAEPPEDATVVVSVELDFVVQSDKEVGADYLNLLDLQGNLHLFGNENGLLEGQSLPILKVEGYVFEGWYVKSEASDAPSTYILVEDQWLFSHGDVLYPSLTKMADTSVEDLEEVEEEEIEQTVTEEKEEAGFAMKFSAELQDVFAPDVTRYEVGEKVVLSMTVPTEKELLSLTVTDAQGEEVEVWGSNLKTTYFFYQPDSDITVTAQWGEFDLEELEELEELEDLEELEEELEENLTATPFDDVKLEDWYGKYVVYVTEEEIMTGNGTLFQPKEDTDRGTVAQVLMNLSGETSTSYDLGDQFADVVGTSYETAAAWCMEQGIMSGYDKTVFGVNDGVTREQFAATIATFAEWMGQSTTPNTETWENFEDLMSVSPWALSPFLWCVEHDLVAGHDGILNPKGNITRGEVATILTTFHKNFVLVA